MMGKIPEMLEGYKTYIVFLLVLIVAVLDTRDWITEEWAQTLYFILTVGGAATLRHGMKKDTEKVIEKVEQQP